MTKKDLMLADEIMYKGIFCTNEWEGPVTNPEILDTRSVLDSALEDIRGIIPDDQLIAISDAIVSYALSCAEAAVLYGIRVSTILKDAATNSDEFSRHVLERRNRRAAK